jgi:hypothetical protein
MLSDVRLSFECKYQPTPLRSLNSPLDNFKPGAIDGARPASIEVKKSPENTQILAEFPSKDVRNELIECHI